jgi:putative N6-adenine-specific DNA methylase
MRSSSLSASSDRSYFAAAAPGLEDTLAEEVRALPSAAGVVAEPGGVRFHGPAALCAAANLHLRSAGRVLLRVGRFHATRLPQLVEAAAALPWERYLRAPGVMVRATCHKSRIYHSGAAAERLTQGIVARLGQEGAAPGAATAEGAPLVLLRGVRDEWEVSLDTSGELLHRRGYRQDTGEAPLRETLAAGLLLRAGYAGGPLCDLCCGSGTFVIEAALMARRIPPGLHRRFAFQDWPDFDEAGWRRLRDEAQAGILPAASLSYGPLCGLDIDAAAVDVARRNAARALGPASAGVSIQQADLFAPVGPAWEAFAPRLPGAMIVANPPYGRRLSSRREVVPFYRRLGRHLRARFGGCQALVLCPDPAAAQALALDLPVIRVPNGGLPILVVHGRVAAVAQCSHGQL